MPVVRRFPENGLALRDRETAQRAPDEPQPHVVFRRCRGRRPDWRAQIETLAGVSARPHLNTAKSPEMARLLDRRRRRRVRGEADGPGVAGIELAQPTAPVLTGAGKLPARGRGGTRHGGEPPHVAVGVKGLAEECPLAKDHHRHPTDGGMHSVVADQHVCACLPSSRVARTPSAIWSESPPDAH
jgi:hypothetical protein